jgi:hypothetical protein
MKNIIVLILVSWLVFSCKTPHDVSQKSISTLQISQNYAAVLKDTSQVKAKPELKFTAAKDSVYSFIPAENNLQKSIFKTTNPINFKKKLLLKNIKYSKNSEPKTKAKKLTNWHVIASGSILFASIIWLLTSPYMAIGIIGIVLAGMIYLSAFTNNAVAEDYKIETPNDDEHLPYNTYAIIAGIIFLISLLCLIPLFYSIAVLFAYAFIGCLFSFIFSLLAILDINAKHGKERGKDLSIIILVISSIPVLLLLTFLVLVLIFGPGDP